MSLTLPEHRESEGIQNLLTTYSVMTEFGRKLREVLAKRRLTEIDAVEGELVKELDRISGIESSVERINAEHSLRMQYLICFGVTPDERGEFRQLLLEAAQHGGLSPKEAAALAHARVQTVPTQRKGALAGSDSDSATDVSLAV